MNLEIVNMTTLGLLLTMNIMQFQPIVFTKLACIYFFIDFLKQLVTISNKNISIILHHCASLYLFYVTFTYSFEYSAECIIQMTFIELSSLFLIVYRKFHNKIYFKNIFKYITFLVWIYQRIFYLPKVLINIYTKHLFLYKTHPNTFLLACGCLLSIQFLSYYWTYLIINQIKKPKVHQLAN